MQTIRVNDKGYYKAVELPMPLTEDEEKRYEEIDALSCGLNSDKWRRKEEYLPDDYFCITDGVRDFRYKGDMYGFLYQYDFSNITKVDVEQMYDENNVFKILNADFLFDDEKQKIADFVSSIRAERYGSDFGICRNGNYYGILGTDRWLKDEFSDQKAFILNQVIATNFPEHYMQLEEHGSLIPFDRCVETLKEIVSNYSNRYGVETMGIKRREEILDYILKETDKVSERWGEHYPVITKEMLVSDKTYIVTETKEFISEELWKKLSNFGKDVLGEYVEDALYECVRNTDMETLLRVAPFLNSQTTDKTFAEFTVYAMEKSTNVQLIDLMDYYFKDGIENPFSLAILHGIDEHLKDNMLDVKEKFAQNIIDSIYSNIEIWNSDYREVCEYLKDFRDEMLEDYGIESKDDYKEFFTPMKMSDGSISITGIEELNLITKINECLDNCNPQIKTFFKESDEKNKQKGIEK